MTTDLSVQQNLESKLGQLIRTNRWRDSIEVSSTADVADKSRQAIERELASRGLDCQAAVAREIRAALARINNGTYGLCQECEEQITPRRLAAVPWAALCLACQEEAENFGAPDDGRELLVS